MFMVKITQKLCMKTTFIMRYDKEFVFTIDF